MRLGAGPVRRRPYGGWAFVFNAVIAAIVALLALGAAASAAERPRILAFGDSLTAGYGLPPGVALPDRLQAKLAESGLSAEVLNAGVSGDTTAGGLARLDWALGARPDIVILELGANDALRGLDPHAAYDNLDKMLTRIQASGAKVLLVGMYAPANWGPEYKSAFNAIYPALAEKHNVKLDPFILEGVAMRPELNQADGLHPNERGVEIIAARMAPLVKQLVEARG